MAISRREFLRYFGGGAAGVVLSQSYLPWLVKTLEAATKGEPPVIWLQGQCCTGCSVSLLNTVHPSIAEVLLKIISLGYHPNVMAGSGDLAISAMEKIYKESAGSYILIMEGAIPTAEDGIYALTGEKEGKHITTLDWAQRLGEKAGAIVSVGTCASYGGIPAGEPNPTQAKGIGELLGKAVLNIPGCPAHPDWIVGSLTHVLMWGLPKLDEYGRPTLFFGKTIHENCPNFYYYNDDILAEKLSDEGCLMHLGCKGGLTHSDCPKRRWNNGVNWCIGAKTPCIGCAQQGFPDECSPMYGQIPDELKPKKVDLGQIEKPKALAG